MEASHYKLISFSEGIAYVSTPNGAAHLVDLYEGIGTCLEFQDRHLPFCYSMAVCKDQVLEPEEFTSSIYTVENYRNISRRRTSWPRRDGRSGFVIFLEETPSLAPSRVCIASIIPDQDVQ